MTKTKTKTARDRLREPSTWAGLAGALLAASGLELAPDTAARLVDLAAAACAFVAVILPEKGGPRA